MQPVSTRELDSVSGGVVWAIFSPISIGAANTAVVNAPQANINIGGVAGQGGGVGVGQVISISL